MFTKTTKVLKEINLHTRDSSEDGKGQPSG